MNGLESKLKDCAKSVLKSCLRVSRYDSVLVIFDRFGAPIAESFSTAALDIECDALLLFIGYQEQRYFSETGRYSQSIRRCLACASILITCVNAADGCTRFRFEILRGALTSGAKILHMPGVDEQMFVDSSHELDFSELQKSGKSLWKTLNNSQDVEIETKSNDGIRHVLRLSTRDRQPHICGGVAQPGEILNIPTGEVYVAPLENSAQGSLVLNGSGPNCVFRPPEQVILKFNAGILDIDNSYFPDEANSKRLLAQVLMPARNKGTANITLGEFGIGLNASVRELSGNVILDEKAAGTAHIALGANTPFGGRLESEVHHDLIFKPSSIRVGGKLLNMEWKNATS